MSGYDGSAFDVRCDRWPGVYVLVCTRGHEHVVKTWVDGWPQSDEVDRLSRAHWDKWHTPHCGRLDVGPCGECDERG